MLIASLVRLQPYPLIPTSWRLSPMSKKKIVSAGLVSLLLISSAFSQPVYSEVIQPANQIQTSLQTRNSGEVIAGMFRLVWRFITRG